MNKHLEVSDTFTTHGGLIMDVIGKDGGMFECVHRPTGWRGLYRIDGKFLKSAADPDRNLHADFYVDGDPA